MKNFKKITFILPLLLLISVFVLDIVLFLGHSSIFRVDSHMGGLGFEVFFNSDTLYLPSLYNDIIKNDGKLVDWFLTPAPYVFPDMILYYLSALISPGGNHFYAAIIFFTVQNVFIHYTLYRIHHLYMTKEWALIVISAMAGLFFVFSPLGYQYHFLSAFHYGQFMIGLIVLYFVLRNIQDQSKVHFPSLFLIMSLTSLVIMSDSIFLLYFIAPILCALGVLWMTEKLHIKSMAAMSASFILGYILGKTAYRSLIPNRIEFIPVFDSNLITLNIDSAVRVFGHVWESVPEQITILSFIFLYVISSFAFKIKLKKHLHKYYIFGGQDFLSLYLVFLSLFMIFVFGTMQFQINVRYATPALLLPLYLFPVFLVPFSPYAKQGLLKVGVFAVVILTLAVFYSSFSALGNKSLYTNYKPGYVKCVDSFLERTGSKTGISGYWQAKQLSILSDFNPVMAQFDEDLIRLDSISTTSWYRDRYDFALIGSLNGILSPLWDKVVSINGNPSETIECGDFKVMYYEKGLSTDPFVNSEKILDYANPVLDTNSSVIMATPPRLFPPGIYRATLNYSSGRNTDEHISDFYLALTDGDGKNVPMMGTNGAVDSSRIVFNLPLSRGVIIGVWADSIGDIKVHSIVIEKSEL